jgi:TetR/AcrR family acrAB operon transcriptional repressor
MVAGREEAQRRAMAADAAETVSDRGVTRTSLAEVAKVAGTTRAVYWHFKDKADLFRAMCDRATLPLDTMFERAGETAQTDPLGTLRALSIGALQSLAGDPRAQNVFEIVFHKSELVDELAGDRTTQARELHVPRADRGTSRQAAALGQLPADVDPHLATDCTR